MKPQAASIQTDTQPWRNDVVSRLDPHRRCMPPSEWPQQHLAVWEAELLPGDDLEEGGSRASHAEASNHMVEAGYGRFLGWLAWGGFFDPNGPPGAQITRPLVRAYLADLFKYNATRTIRNRLVALKIMAGIMDPTRDWSWLNRGISFVRARHKPARPKLHRIVEIKELFDFGFREMDRLMPMKPDLRDFPIFRNHLMVSTLAACPLRAGNFIGLTLDRTLARRDHQWWVQIPASETKPRNDDIELPLPRALVPYIDFYLAGYLLPSLREAGLPTADAPFWITNNGARISLENFSHQISSTTERGLGRRVNPHLFRDCAATSIAIHDPAHLAIVLTLLGHRSLETMRRHYDQSRGIEAIRLVQQCLLSLGSGVTGKRADSRLAGAEARDPDRFGESIGNPASLMSSHGGSRAGRD